MESNAFLSDDHDDQRVLELQDVTTLVQDSRQAARPVTNLEIDDRAIERGLT